MRKFEGGIILFEVWHNRKNIGSSRYRGHWWVKYFKELELFKQCKKYDFVIFQKCYWLNYMKVYDGIKILDLVDPDWLEGKPIKEIANLIDAFTCCTEKLATFLRQLTDKPVVVIPDRQDLEYCKEKKIHRGRAKSCVWFGYSHNSHVLTQTIPYLTELGLDLTVISEKYTTVCDGKESFKQNEKWKKWQLDTSGREIIKHDIVLMPHSFKSRDQFKSNNKTTYSWAIGMPVATNFDELKRFIDEAERKKEAEKRLKEVKEHYDIKQSVIQLKGLINELKGKKGKNENL